MADNVFGIDVLRALLVSVPTAFLTVQLSLRRFYKEKWWESKRNTYISVFEAIHHLKELEDEWYWYVRYPEKDRNDPSEESQRATEKMKHDLEKAIALAKFQLCDDAVQVLETYVAERRNAKRNDPDDTQGLHRDALQGCLDSLIEVARKDLRIESRSFSWKMLERLRAKTKSMFIRN